MAKQSSLVPVERIEKAILVIRGEKVILDEDLARLYGVPTMRLNEQVSRNLDRFPSDFMFRLNKEEFQFLKSQFAISKKSGRGGRRRPPRAFTEHGILMLSSVLRSKRAVQVNIEIMRAFVNMRQLLTEREGLVKRIEALERHYDKQFRIIFDAIKKLMEPPDKKSKQRMGFYVKK